MILNNGKFEFAADKPEFREGIRYMKRLYDEGLLAPETYTQSLKQLKGMGENPLVPILGSSMALWYGNFVTNMGKSGRFLEWAPAPPLEGPEGVRWARTSNYRVQPHTLVTKECKYPEVVVRWADYFYGPEGAREASTGRKDVDWRWAKPGEMAYTGRPAVAYKFPHVKYELANNVWRHSAPHFASTDIRDTLAMDAETVKINQAPKLWFATKDLYEQYKKKEIPPNLFFNEEQAMEVGEISPALRSHVTASIARFVTGERNIDAEWDPYKQELAGIGWKRYVELHQQAYDAKYKK